MVEAHDRESTDLPEWRPHRRHAIPLRPDRVPALFARAGIPWRAVPCLDLVPERRWAGTPESVKHQHRPARNIGQEAVSVGDRPADGFPPRGRIRSMIRGPSETPVTADPRYRSCARRWLMVAAIETPRVDSCSQIATISTRSSRPMRSAAFRVYKRASWACAVAAIKRSNARARGRRPTPATAAARRP